MGQIGNPDRRIEAEPVVPATPLPSRHPAPAAPSVPDPATTPAEPAQEPVPA